MNNYIYIMTDPRKPISSSFGTDIEFLFEPFYVGKGRGKRLIHHFYKCNIEKDLNRHKCNKVKLVLQGLTRDEYIERYVIVQYFNSHEEALKREMYLINKIGRTKHQEGPLTNITGGGEGWGVPWNKDKKCPQIGRKGKTSWCKGLNLRDYYGDRWDTMSFGRHKGTPSSLKGIKNPKISERLKTVDIDDDIVDSICNDYIEGYSTPELERKYNMVPYHIYWSLDKNNIVRRSKGDTQFLKYRQVKDVVISLLEDGVERTSIIKTLGDTHDFHIKDTRTLLKIYRYYTGKEFHSNV